MPAPRRDGTRFLARNDELRALDAQFAAGARLVTIVGPPGIGKSRLAREFLATRSECRVFACDLAAARDLDGVCHALAHTMGASLAAASSPAAAVRQLGHALRDGAADIVLLDEFEHVTDTAALCLEPWLDASATTFLVTSRERLRLSDERVYELGPLALPASDREDDIERSPAVQLLVDRVRRIRHDYAPAADAHHLAAVARALDGIPLAVELAAVRVAALGAAAVRARLGDTLGLLSRGTRGAHAKTLRESIEASWQLLSEPERTALAQCSVFRGGFSLDAAEAVIDVGAANDVLDLVQSLRERSLLHGAERLALYGSIRDFAAEKLADPEPTRARHARQFVTFAEHWSRHVDGANGREAIARLGAERDNLLAVIQRGSQPSADRDARSAALRCLTALDPLVWRLGPVTTQLDLLEAALAPADAGIDVSLRARAHIARGRMRDRHGRMLDAAADYEAARALGASSGDASVEGHALTSLGLLASRRRDLAATRAWLEQAIERCERGGNGRQQAVASGWLGIVTIEMGDEGRGWALCERALGLHRANDHPAGEAVLLGIMGVAALDRGRATEARPLIERSLQLHRQLGHTTYEAHAISYLGTLALMEGKLEEAAQHFVTSRDMARSSGHTRAEATDEGYLGVVRREQGRSIEALERLRAAASLLDEVDARHAALFRTHAAGVQADLGSLDAARAALDRARSVFSDDDPLALVCAITEAHLELSQAAPATDERAEAHRRAAREIVERTASAARGAHSIDPRVAWRIAERAVASAAIGVATRSTPWRVDAGGEWFSTPDGVRVETAHRPVLSRLLVHLAEQRVRSPGRAVRPGELLAAGWPGERILPAAARNRLKMCLATLRKLGLRGLLVTHAKGYLLDAGAPFELVSPSRS